MWWTKTCCSIQFCVDFDNNKNVINGDRILMINTDDENDNVEVQSYDGVDDDHAIYNNHYDYDVEQL